MAKFVFKLEAVLKQRKWQEQECQRELDVKQRALAELEGTLKRLNEQVQSSNEDVRRNRLVGALDMSFLAAHRRFLAAMQRQAIEVIQRMALAQKQVVEAQGLLAEASKRRKVIEKLRENHHARWRKEQARRQLIEQDEIGMQIAYADLTGSAAELGERAR
jgi:flagellar export protein FliJ